MPKMPGNLRSVIVHDWNLSNNAYSTNLRRFLAAAAGAANLLEISVYNGGLLMAAAAGMISLLPVLLRFRQGLRGTALLHAWWAACLAWVVWTIVPLAAWIRPAWTGALWYFGAIAALIPPIAALGARRPINRVWTGFVLIPLIFVFSWPIVPAVWRAPGSVMAFDLETPVVVGYMLVSIMGAGNYLGLSHTIPAVLWLLGGWLAVLPLCPTTARLLPAALPAASVSAGCLVLAVWMADRQVVHRCHRAAPAGLPLTRVWMDFRELFGVVWARRVMDRFNEDARRERAAYRLGWDGLEFPATAALEVPDRSLGLQGAETSLRWLLQKFVDPAWIDSRLPQDRAPSLQCEADAIVTPPG